MLSWIIQFSVISIILIFLVHHLINFFKSTLTVPKLKDLVNSPTQKYENMYNIISNKNTLNMSNMSNASYKNEYTIADLLPKQEEPNMKSELKNFLKKQFNNSNDSTDILALDSIMDLKSFANFSPL